MARIPGLGNKIDDVIKGLGKAVQQSDEVIVAAAKNKGDDLASAIKNGVNKVKSNRGMSNNFVSEQAKESVRRTVQNVSSAQANQKTARNVVIGFDMDKATRVSKEVASTKIPKRNNTAEIREIADRMAHQKTTASTVTGHNAKVRQTEMDTILNNVMDSRGARDIPEGRSRKLKSKIDQAVDNVTNNAETNKALNNLEKIKDLETVPIPKGEELKKVRYASRQNIDDFIKRDNYKSAQERLRNNKPGDIGPLMDEIKTIEIKDSPFQNKFDFSDDGGPRTNSSGGGNGNKNTNSNTNTNSGPEGGPNDRRSWKDYADDYFGGIGDTYKGVRDGGNFWDALESAHTNDDGSLRWGRVAGTYAAAAVGSRIISGGGLYKDRYGNSNIPGVPFI